MTLALSLFAGQAFALPSGVVVPLKGSAGIKSGAEAGITEMIRAAFKSKLALTDDAKTKSALKTAGCSGAQCGSVAAKLAQGAEARFVVIPVINYEFEIYNIKLSLADADFIGDSMVEVSGTCEFCAEGELSAKLKELAGDAKISSALARLGKPKGPTSFTLSVVTSPAGAEVFVNGASRGVSPLSLSGLTAKPYELEVKLKGYVSQKKTVTPPKPLPKDPISESFTLKPKAPTSFPLEIRTKPKGATVTLDGKTIKVKTPFKAKIRPGKHELSIKLKGYQEYKKSFETPKQAETIKVIVALSKVAPKPKPKPKKPAPKAKTQPKAKVQPNAPISFTAPPKPPLISGNVSGALIATGVVTSGLGIALLGMHGEIACDGGETRKTCPEIYETKYPAGALLGFGAAALGAGVISLIINSDWPESAPASNVKADVKTDVKASAQTRWVPSVAPTNGGASASLSLTF